MEVFDEMHQRDVSCKNIQLDETLYSALINMYAKWNTDFLPYDCAPIQLPTLKTFIFKYF
jgi:hypothetical protein